MTWYPSSSSSRCWLIILFLALQQYSSITSERTLHFYTKLFELNIHQVVPSALVICENGPSANDSFNSSSSSCAPSESEVYFVYQDTPEAPPEDEPSAPAAIARLPSPICLTQPKLFRDSRYGPKRVRKYSWYYSYSSNGDSAACAEHQLQSVFAFNVSALNPGTIIVGVVTNDSRITNANTTYMTVKVQRSSFLGTMIDVVGWIYFVAWSISFYPQLILNCFTRSVIGLSFDFTLLNFCGHFSYFVFNYAFYFIYSIQADYKKANPHSVIPVEWSDVLFSTHATVLTAINALCIICFERGNQRFHWFSIAIASAIGVLYICALTLRLVGWPAVFTWLAFIYLFSYMKLFITLIKYLPQVWLNFRRRSTTGWSIYGVLLDMTGGIFNLLQMILVSINYNDWSTMVGNPTKLGLSLLSLLFNFVFIFQHYCLYSDRACCSYGGRGQPIYENFMNESHPIDPEAAAGDSDNPTFRPLDDSDEQIRRMNLKKSRRNQKMAAQSDREANPPADGTGSSVQQQQQQQVKLQSASSNEHSAPSQQTSAAPPTLSHVMIVDETRLAAGATADGSSAATNQNPTFPDNSQRSISARDSSLQ